MKTNPKEKIRETIIKNDMNLIDRERVSNIRIVNLTDLTKDLVALFKELKK